MEISIKGILRIIKKNIVFIIILSLLVSMCSFFVTTFFVKKTYTTAVKLYVETSYDEASGTERLSLYSYAEKLVATYIQLLDTNNFYSDVSETLKGKYTATELSQSITFKGIEDTEVFEAIVVADSPSEAKNIADAVAETAPKTISEFKSKAQLKIVDEATIPKKPSSPNTIKNVLIAFIAGLVISLIISFVRDYFDIKIKYNEEMTTIFDLPILAAIPDFEYFTNSKKLSRQKYTEKSTSDNI